MRRILSLILVSSVLIILAQPGVSADPSSPLKVGDAAPDFSLVGSDGKTYAAKDFAGKKPIVIAWFPKAFTGGCTKQCKSMKEGGVTLREYDIAYFTASCDPVEKNTEFAKHLELDYPILSDPTGAIAKQFGIYSSERSSRVTFIIGVDGKIAVVDDKVQTENHANEIAEHLEKLGVKKKS